MSVTTTISGRYKYEYQDNYEAYLRCMSVGWFKRKRILHLPAQLVVEEDTNTGLYTIYGDYCLKKTLLLGEEHEEILPNTESVTAVTIKEGENVLTTRIRDPWNLVIRREFRRSGMVETIVHQESNLECVRYFRRCQRVIPWTAPSETS